jgi:fibrillarin-like pre-rRNA processing protein
VFQDIAQPNQVDIFLKNCNAFLKRGGFGLLALKARSVDVSRRPTDIFKEVRVQLEKSNMVIVDYRTLEPFERDHAMFVCKKK